MLYVYIFRHRFPVNARAWPFHFHFMQVLQALLTMIPIWDGNYNIFVSCIFPTENQGKCTLQKEEVSSIDLHLDDDMDFQSSSQSTYKPSDVQYMGSEGNSKCASEMKKRESSNGLKGRSWTMTLLHAGQYCVFFPSDNQTIYIHPNDKDVKFLD